MDDSGSLLATLAQSSAAVVAIIGGFLVSRLVALSSEREGIKRQLRAARERLSLHRADFELIHEDRLQTSVAYMREDLLGRLVAGSESSTDRDLEDLIMEDGVPRGSSLEELLPFARETRDRVGVVFADIQALLRENDDSTIDLKELKARGLVVPEDDLNLYENVLQVLCEKLPDPPKPAGLAGFRVSMPMGGFGDIQPSWIHELDMRRLDESIRDEQQLRAQVTAAEQEVERLASDLRVFAQPIGVVPAVWILALYSLLGIVAPVVAMAFGPSELPTCWTVVLITAFVVGLAAVLLYIVWYLRKVAPDEAEEGAA